MSPLIIAVLIGVGVVMLLGSYPGWLWYKRRQRKKLIEKHDELFRAVFPEGEEQQTMSRPLLEKTLSEVDAHIAFLQECQRRLAAKAFASPLGVDLGLQLHTTLADLIKEAQKERDSVIKIGNKSGLGHEEPEEDAE